MIPSRNFDGAGSGNGVRYRVSACRKRLRFSRTIHRRLAHIQQDEQAKEIETRSTPGRETTGVLLAASGTPEEAEST
jgi:hypothetical protein